MACPLRVLIVEDSKADTDLILQALRCVKSDPIWVLVETADGLRAALAASTWDAVTSGFFLSGFGGPAALEIVRESDPDLPFIIVSETVGEDAAVAMMRAGANDYVHKHDIARLAPAIEREVREAGHRREKRAAERLAFHWAAIVESSDDAIISKTLDGTITSWNAAAEKLYGWSEAEAIGRNVSFLVPDDKADELTGILDRLRAGERVEYFETVRTNRDGRRIDVSMTVSPVLGSDGKLVGVSKTARDIRERKKAEAALLRSEKRCRELLEAIPSMVWVYDAKGRPLMHSRRWYDYTGQTTAEIDANRWHEALHPDDVVEALAVWNRSKNSGEPYYAEYRIRRTDGVYRWFLSQGTAQREAGEIEQWVGICTDIDDRKRAEQATRHAQHRLQHVLSSSPAILYTSTISDEQIQGINWISDNLEERLGYRPEAVLDPAWWMGNIHPDDRAGVIEQTQGVLFKVGHATHEFRFKHHDGRYRWTLGEIRLIRDSTGRAVEGVGSWSDITERKRLEDQFHQAQKMEAIGQLAGGIAHDFNNLLTIINGYSSLLLEDLPRTAPSHEMLEEIHKAGQRSAGLTRQLLSFSRQQVLAPRVLDLNSVVIDTEKMLCRMIGEDVRLTTTLGSALGLVRADPGQIEQVLMNLAVNARDAMCIGGRLTIETFNVNLDETYLRMHADARAGPHVLLSITDTGGGMPSEVQAKIFEPFFTTKEPGKGTGLGLATCYGIIKQSSGHITVYSELGIGTTFKVYLPCVEPMVGEVKLNPDRRPLLRGTETILLAEDEAGVRALARRVLTDCGYTVLEAGDGEEAIRVAIEHEGPIHLLITDVVMPGSGGRAVAERVAVGRPEMRVIFVSGYTDDAVIRHGVLSEGVNFLQKPFSPVDLAFEVREVLDR